MITVIIFGGFDQIPIIVILKSSGYSPVFQHDGKSVYIKVFFILHAIIHVIFPVDDGIASQTTNWLAFLIIILLPVNISNLIVCILYPIIGVPIQGRRLIIAVQPAFSHNLLVADGLNPGDKSFFTRYWISSIIKICLLDGFSVFTFLHRF